MAERPRVEASTTQNYDEIRDGCGTVASHGLSASITVDFALHDHERALSVLDEAVQEVRDQIADLPD